MSTHPRTDVASHPAMEYTGDTLVVSVGDMERLETELAAVRAELAESKKRDLLYASQISLMLGYAPTDVFYQPSGGSKKLLTRIEIGDTLYVVRKDALPVPPTAKTSGPEFPIPFRVRHPEAFKA